MTRKTLDTFKAAKAQPGSLWRRGIQASTNLFAIVVVIGVGALVWRHSASARALPANDAHVSPTPEFSTRPNLAGETWYNVKEPLTWELLRGRYVVVEFWATWCGPCMANVENLRALQKEYGPKGLVVIGVTREGADKVGAYVKKKEMNYVICAGQPKDCNKDVTSIPYAVLVDPKGTIAWQGHPSGLEKEIGRALTGSASTEFTRVLSLGEKVGRLQDRPDYAKGYDPGNLNLEYEALSGRVGSLKAVDCERFFAFYWRNLPSGDWGGDAVTRMDTLVATLKLVLEASSAGNALLLRAIEGEHLKRLEVTSLPYRERRYLIGCSTKICKGRESELRTALKGRLQVETHPIVRFEINQLMEGQPEDGASVSKSRLKLARERHAALRKQATIERKSAPSDFREWDDFLKQMYDPINGIARGEQTDATIRLLSRHYYNHATRSDSDLLIRSQVLYELGVKFFRYSESDDPAAHTRRLVLFEIAQTNDSEPGLRRAALAGLETVGINGLEQSALLAFANQRLGVETDAAVRAYLQWLKLSATNIDALH